MHFLSHAMLGFKQSIKGKQQSIVVYARCCQGNIASALLMSNLKNVPHSSLLVEKREFSEICTAGILRPIVIHGGAFTILFGRILFFNVLCIKECYMKY